MIATAVMFCAGVFYANAETLSVPTGSQDSLATADYAGVLYSTYTISSLISGTGVHYATITAPGLLGVPLGKSQSKGISGVFYGIQFPTGTTVDFVDVYDSTSSDVGRNTYAMTRVYNVGASTGGPGAFSGGFSGPAKPMRFFQGLIIRPSRADFPTLNTLFYVFQ